MKNIFISYSSNDKEIVRRIKRDIQACGHNIWIYPAAIDPGEDIIKEESEGIIKSDVVLVMLSNNANSSEAVKKEIRMAEETEARTGRKKLYFVNIDPAFPLDTDSKQKADLSNKKNYAAEFHRLLRKIETHCDFEIKYKIDEDDETPNWFRFTLWTEGKAIDKVKCVEYYIHPKIAVDIYTKTYRRRQDKEFCLVFYSPHNENVYAEVTLLDGSTQEIRAYIETT